MSINGSLELSFISLAEKSELGDRKWESLQHKNINCTTTLYVIAFVDHLSPKKLENRIELIDIMATPTDLLQVYKNPTQNLEIPLLKTNTSHNKIHIGEIASEILL